VLQGHGFETLHFAADLTLEMRMRWVMLAGQLIVGRKAVRGQFADQLQAYKVVQDAIHRYFIHGTPGPNGLQHLPGLPGPVFGAQSLQNLETQGRGPETAMDQGRLEIASITHASSIPVFN